jgi:hypothetical protein
VNKNEKKMLQKRINIVGSFIEKCNDLENKFKKGTHLRDWRNSDDLSIQYLDEFENKMKQFDKKKINQKRNSMNKFIRNNSSKVQSLQWNKQKEAITQQQNRINEIKENIEKIFPKLSDGSNSKLYDKLLKQQKNLIKDLKQEKNKLKNKLYLNMKKMTRIIMYSIMIKTLSIVTYIKI